MSVLPDIAYQHQHCRITLKVSPSEWLQTAMIARYDALY